jgi:hypothetical protein
MVKNFFIINIVVFILIISTIGCIENNEKDEIILTVNFNNYNAEYSLEDLESIESYTGSGRFIKTKLLPESIVLSDIVTYTGIRMYKILENIPNLPDNYNISVVSSDDWVSTYSMKDIDGIVDVYDEEGNILVNKTAVMILAFKENGDYYSEIDPDSETGPLRIAFVDENVITSSNLWSKMVISIDVISI